MSEVIIVVLILIAIFATGFAFGSLFWPRYHRWRQARLSAKIDAELMPTALTEGYVRKGGHNPPPQNFARPAPPSPFAPKLRRGKFPVRRLTLADILARPPLPSEPQPPQPAKDDKTERTMLPSIEWGR